MKKFIKENLVLMLGIFLPVLLILVFFFASILPKMLSEPPQFEALLVSTKYQDAGYYFDFSIENGQVMAVVDAKKKGEGKYSNRRKQVLFAYNAKTQTVREITVDGSQLPEGVKTQVVEARNLKIDSAEIAPDGYIFDGSRYRSRGLVGGLFGGSSRSNYRLVKGNVSYKIPPHKHNNGYDSYYNQLTFLGWVINSKGK